MADDCRLTVDVSGFKYTIKRELLVRWPETLLGQLALKSVKSNADGESTDLLIDRPVGCFEAILAYYQTDELHMPSSVCPQAFKKELDFWGFRYNELEQCCLFRYLQFIDDHNKKSNFLKQQQKIEAEEDRKPRRIRSKIWKLIDNREQTISAKIFLLVGILFVISSAISMSLNTLPVNRRALTPCEIQDYYRDDYTGNDASVGIFLSLDCYDISIYEDYIEVKHVGNFSIPGSFPVLTVKNDVFITVEYITVAFFKIELLFRLTCCPSIKKYMISWMNVVDILSLIAGYLTIILDEVVSKHNLVLMKNILEHLQILRLLRLIRYSQHFKTIQVLKFSLVQNFRDLLVLLLYLVIGVLFFANIMYLLEGDGNLGTIPKAWWLGIITMTTVGYGDVTPSSPAGKVLCGFCAVGGVILISIILPIFIDSFLSFYGVAQLNITSGSSSNDNLTKKDRDECISKITTSKTKTAWS